MSRRTRIQVLIIGGMLALVGGVVAVVLLVQRTPPAEQAAGAPTTSLADGARTLGAAPQATVEVTEFLDFECEACGAMYPVVESLRERYAGRVAFTFRYFPLPGHRNSGNAALAVEAAARQGQLEPMYDELFTTQAEWGESTTSQAARFRDAAERLGLDMSRYDADVADAAVKARIERDIRLGTDLGVQATPTFFVDGEAIRLERIDDLEAAITAALTD